MKESINLVRNMLHRSKHHPSYLARVRKALRYFTICIILGGLAIFAIDRWVTYSTQDQLFHSIEKIPAFDVAVVLGTSKYLGRTLNEYYINRINAAIGLYDQGKVNHFLLSGDNAHRSYNEPWTMKRDLLRAQVPDTQIFLDYAGFRTLDSVVRAKEIFDTDNFLIISQKFHCERALFIANFYDIQAKCLAVPGPTKHSGFKVRFREVFARVKAVLDLYITQTEPRFLGPKEPIPSKDSRLTEERTVIEEKVVTKTNQAIEKNVVTENTAIEEIETETLVESEVIENQPTSLPQATTE